MKDMNQKQYLPEIPADNDLETILSEAVWAAHSLFRRGKTSGSSANLSVIHNGVIYISASGTCFGTLTTNDFAAVAPDGTVLPGKKPSKELPLHRMLYQSDAAVRAVIHTHSTYSVLWSCTNYATAHPFNCIPPITPYLGMKLGPVGLVPYEKPGSEELFAAFGNALGKSSGFLLNRHGPVVPGRDVMDAFFRLEELEESARIAWELRNETDFPIA